MWFKSREHKGLVLTQTVLPERIDGPLLAGPDVSWMKGLRVGDNQGNHGACAIFTFANWAERVRGMKITDEECLDVYKRAIRSMALATNSGLTNPQAFRAALSAGWLGGARSLQAAHTLEPLKDQPMIAGFSVTDALRNTNSSGCMDHAASDAVYGYHDMLIVACGRLDQAQPDEEERVIWEENSWGPTFGFKGCCFQRESLFRKICKEMWIIR